MPAREHRPDDAPWRGPREGVVEDRPPGDAAALIEDALEFMYPTDEPSTQPPPDKENTMPTFIDDLDIVDPTTVEQTGPAYPVAQWLNGDPKLAAVGGVTHTGGLILPSKYLDEQVAPPPGWTRTTVAFSSGKSEAVLAAPKPRLAVIRTRFRWFVVYNGVTTFYPRSGYHENSGMRGHTQALCAVHGFDFPVVATFKGKASQEFERLLREFSQKIQEAAQRIVKDKSRRWPRFAFYLRLAPGPHVKVGQKGQESIITPPVLELPNVITEDYLGKVYVGRDKLVELQALYHQAAEWGAAWDRPGAEEAERDIDPDTGEITGGGGGNGWAQELEPF